MITSFILGATFTWVAATSGPAADGYKIYTGEQPGVYTNSVDVGNVTTHDMDVDFSVVKYFTVRPYNSFGEGPEVDEVIAGKPDVVSQFQITP